MVSVEQQLHTEVRRYLAQHADRRHADGRSVDESTPVADVSVLRVSALLSLSLVLTGATSHAVIAGPSLSVLLVWTLLGPMLVWAVVAVAGRWSRAMEGDAT